MIIGGTGPYDSFVGTADENLKIYKKKIMNKLIYNDIFLQKVFKRKFRTGIAYHACIMDFLSSKQRVLFTIRRLMEIPICQARIVIQYWEKTKVVTDLLEQYDLNNYQVIREYKKDHVKPGYINIEVSSQTLNEAFLYELLKRHYDADFSRPNALDLVPYFIIDTGNTEIIAIKCYDDRGFYQYFIRKEDKRIKKLMCSQRVCPPVSGERRRMNNERIL